MAFSRQDRNRSFGINEEALSRDIQRAQRAAVGSGMQIGREATDAARGASAIYADQIASAGGFGGTGFGETLRGLMSSADADAINEAEARREARLLQDAQGIGASMLAEEAASETAKAEKKLRGASEAGSVLSMIGGLGTTAMGISGALPALMAGGAAAAGPIALPLLIGGGIASALGTVGKAAGAIGKSQAEGDISKIQRQVAGFDMPEVKGLNSTGLGVRGQDNIFTGGVADPKRRRLGDNSYANALANYTNTYFG